jgi:hypothetical protein
MVEISVGGTLSNVHMARLHGWFSFGYARLKQAAAASESKTGQFDHEWMNLNPFDFLAREVAGSDGSVLR